MDSRVDRCGDEITFIAPSGMVCDFHPTQSQRSVIMTKLINHEGTKSPGGFNFLAPFASPWLRRAFLWFSPLLFLAIFFFFPLSKILALTFDLEALTAENLRITFHVLGFTLYQASLSTFLTLLLGLPSVYLFARFNFRGKVLLRTLTAVPFMLPTVVVAVSFNALLGQRGLINNFIYPSSFILRPFLAILLAHVFYNTTIIIRVVGNALSSLDPKLEQTARSLGADSLRVWWNVILPIIQPSILASSLLVFLFDFTSFGVILLLGGSQFSTLEVEIYLRVLKLPNLSLAALLSVIQLICTILVSILYTRMATRSTAQTAPRSKSSNLRKAKTLREKSSLRYSVFCFLRSSFLPLPLCLSVPSSDSKPIVVNAAQFNTDSQPITIPSSLSTAAARSFMFHPFKPQPIHSATLAQPSRSRFFLAFLPRLHWQNQPASKGFLTLLSCFHSVHQQ